MNKNEYQLFKVVSETLTVGNGNFGIQKKRGQVILKLTDISQAFKGDGENTVEIIMNRGDKFIVKDIDLYELLHKLDRIKKGYI